MDILKILLIEDNRGDARLIREMFSDSTLKNVEVFHEELLSKGIARLETENIDLALLDLYLPDSTSLESLKLINSKFSNVPVVILTGLADEEMAVEAVRNGAQDYLFKTDLNSPLLIRTIRYAMERKASEIEKEKLIKELQQALNDVTNLRSLLPICANCKKIRDDNGYWNQIETYLRKNSGIDFSHTICPDCKKKLYPQMEK